MDKTFSDVEGEIDLPFLPDGAGTPFGQGALGTRGLTAVVAGVRPECVLFSGLTGVSLELVSALETFAERFEGRRSSQCVGIQVNTKYDSCTYIRYFQKEGSGLPSFDFEREITGGFDMPHNQAWVSYTCQVPCLVQVYVWH